MTDWESLPAAVREMMSPEFWASLSEEERQARLKLPIDDISEGARQAYVPEEGGDGKK